VVERIGEGLPVDTVLVSRQSIGKTWREIFASGGPVKGYVTSRILRLRGLEDGHNSGPGVDSYERYIYFHGTCYEDRIGQPTSHGCITLLNPEMIELHDSIPLGSLVWLTL
jgi:lipoprotein-anchoring transpeptidase ErfK/SrfK